MVAQAVWLSREWCGQVVVQMESQTVRISLESPGNMPVRRGLYTKSWKLVVKLFGNNKVINVTFMSTSEAGKARVTFSYLWWPTYLCYYLMMALMAFGICCPTIWHLRIFNILSWRCWEMACAGRTFWPSPEAGHQTLLWPSCETCLPYTQNRGASLSLKVEAQWEEPEGTGLDKFLPVYYTELTPCPITFLQDSSIHQT